MASDGFCEATEEVVGRKVLAMLGDHNAVANYSVLVPTRTGAAIALRCRRCREDRPYFALEGKPRCTFPKRSRMPRMASAAL